MRKTVLRSLAVTLLSFFVCVPSLLAQEKVTVSGKVVDETDRPLIAVGVIQKGTTNGVITDTDGNYSITVLKGTTLVYACIGYTTQEKIVTEGGVFNVKLLPDVISLDETVVVGYGVQKKRDVTGSITQVKSEDIANRTS